MQHSPVPLLPHAGRTGTGLCACQHAPGGEDHADERGDRYGDREDVDAPGQLLHALPLAHHVPTSQLIEVVLRANNGVASEGIMATNQLIVAEASEFLYGLSHRIPASTTAAVRSPERLRERAGTLTLPRALGRSGGLPARAPAA